MVANLINSSIALGVSQLAKEKDRIAIINGSGSSRLTNDACTPSEIAAVCALAWLMKRAAAAATINDFCIPAVMVAPPRGLSDAGLVRFLSHA